MRHREIFHQDSDSQTSSQDREGEFSARLQQSGKHKKSATGDIWSPPTHTNADSELTSLVTQKPNIQTNACTVIVAPLRSHTKKPGYISQSISNYSFIKV